MLNSCNYETTIQKLVITITQMWHECSNRVNKWEAQTTAKPQPQKIRSVCVCVCVCVSVCVCVCLFSVILVIFIFGLLVLLSTVYIMLIRSLQATSKHYNTTDTQHNLTACLHSVWEALKVKTAYLRLQICFILRVYNVGHVFISTWGVS